MAESIFAGAPSAAGGAAAEATAATAAVTLAQVMAPASMFLGGIAAVVMDQISGTQAENARRAASGGLESKLIASPSITKSLIHLMLTDPGAYVRSSFAQQLTSTGLDPWAELGNDVNRYVAGAQAAGMDPQEAAAKGLDMGGVSAVIMQFADVNPAVAAVTEWWRNNWQTLPGYEQVGATGTAGYERESGR